MSNWARDPTTFIYYTAYTGPEIVRLTENGEDLTRIFQYDAVIAEGQYCHDITRGRLYVYPNNDGIGIRTPKGNNKIYVAYFWVCITNVQNQAHPITFVPRIGETYGGTITCEYYPYVSSQGECSVTMNISQYYQDAIKMQFGQIRAGNAAFWYSHMGEWIFINSPFFVKVGKIDDVYADFTDVFAGKLSEPSYNDQGIAIACRDVRYGILKSIPPDKFLVANHPDMDEEFVDTPIPILFGIKENISPVNINPYSLTDQWGAAGGDFETWQDANNLTYWRSIVVGGSTVNRDGVNQRTGTYCCRLDIDAANSTAVVRTLTATTKSYFDYADGIWLNPGCGYAILFYYYNSVAAKTSEWRLNINVGGTVYYWDDGAQEWTTVVTDNSLANALAYTLVTSIFYVPETASLYSETETGTQYPLYFRFGNDSAASSSIYIDDFRIVSLPTYKISQTVFNDDFANKISIQSIDNVYQAGVEIFTPGDYVPFLEAGLFVLLANPADDVITCNARGLKIEYDFTTGALVAPNTFTENVADILYFTLTVLNKIPVASCNISDFGNLQTARTQRLGWYLKELTDTIEFAKLLQRSSIFHYIINVNGEHTVKYYKRSISADAVHLRNGDYGKYEYSPGTKSVFKRIVLKYAKHPMSSEYSIYTYDKDSVEYIYGETRTLGGDGIITALVTEAEIEALAIFYSSLVESPPAKVNITTITPAIFSNIPTDKVYLNRSVINDEGTEISIHDDEIYAIISHRKNLKNMTSDLTLGLDTAMAGQAIYGDIALVNDHIDHDDHADSVHADVLHGDVAYQDHDDHDDEPYVDSHDDHTVYFDHDDHQDYTDAGHIDHDDHDDHTGHQDETINILYVDHTDHDDFHTDTPHEDGYDDYTDHDDIYTDIPYTDSWL